MKYHKPLLSLRLLARKKKFQRTSRSALDSFMAMQFVAMCPRFPQSTHKIPSVAVLYLSVPRACLLIPSLTLSSSRTLTLASTFFDQTRISPLVSPLPSVSSPLSAQEYCHTDAGAVLPHADSPDQYVFRVPYQVSVLLEMILVCGNGARYASFLLPRLLIYTLN